MSEKLFQRRKGRVYSARTRPLWRKLLDYLLAAVLLFSLMFLVARLNESRQIRYYDTPVVNDGDSLTLGGVRIRLWGIDAPELHQSCSLQGKSYACGQNSRTALRVLINGKRVDCRGIEHDKYDRLLAVCTVGAIEINAAMVEVRVGHILWRI
ncbi:MAG: thermonuclease family protein [Mesorhizobium sp.]